MGTSLEARKQHIHAPLSSLAGKTSSKSPWAMRFAQPTRPIGGKLKPRATLVTRGLGGGLDWAVREPPNLTSTGLPPAAPEGERMDPDKVDSSVPEPM